MKTIHRFAILLAALVSFAFPGRAWSDTFGSGLNTFDIEFVAIVNPGNIPNAADTTGSPNPAGSVPYDFRIGSYEVSRDMVIKANAVVGLGITMSNFGGASTPATDVSWNEAARFVNWLNTSTGHTPAYKFELQPGDVGYSANANILLWDPGDPGYNPNNLYRNNRARYFLPSVDEWYKAAYYHPVDGVYYDYPTGSNTAPTPVNSGTAPGTAVYALQPGPADISQAGGLSPFGTMGQGGNAYEWEETAFNLLNTSASTARAIRGGNWGFSGSGDLHVLSRSGVAPTFKSNVGIGFRVASVIPEPSTVLLAAMASVGLLLRRKR